MTRFRVLGRVHVADPQADRALGGGQARVLLAYLIARRGLAAPTEVVIEALWADEPPPTAPTIVHGLVRRLRQALGPEVLAHDDGGYRLAVPEDQVDLWVLDDLLAAGDVDAVRRAWREPAFGTYADRVWARDAVKAFEQVVRPDPDTGGLLRARRRVPVSRLVGRRRELAQVEEATRRSRLVTIVGLGGVGKTRIALEALRQLHPEHDAFVDIGAAMGPVASRVATDLGLAPSGDPERDLRAAASLIGRRPHVLLLDGCERALPGAASTVEVLLGACPELTVLATSRGALGVPGEHVVPVLPFAQPGDPRGDAVELLLDRARALGMVVTPADRGRAAAICRRCAGVPLAIELAVSELVLETEPITRVAPGTPGPPTPEQAVQEIVAQALRQLSDPTCRTAVRLSLLVAGFTPDLVAAVRPDGSTAGGILQELVSTGLVATESFGTARRLRFLDRVRDSLIVQADADDHATVLAAVTAVFRAVRPDLAAPVSVPALTRAVEELPNAQALLFRLRDQGRHAEGLALATAIADTWAEDGQWAHGAAQVGAALEAVRPAPAEEGDDSPAGPPADAAPAAAPHDATPVDPLAWAYAVRAWGAVTGTYAGARRMMPHLLEAVEIAHDAGDLPLEGHLRMHLANALGYDGALEEALVHVSRLGEIGEALDSDYVRIGARMLLATGRFLTGDAAVARQELAALADELERRGARGDAARVRRTLSLACRADGDLPAALAALSDAERLALESKARGTLSTTRSDIADLRFQLGDPAAEALHGALEAALTVGNLRAAGIVRTRLGELGHDPAVIALGTLDLWHADQRWAAASLATLLAELAESHPLHAIGPAAIATLAQGWGSPLDVRESALVAPHLHADPPAEGWETDVLAHLAALATAGSA